MLPFAAATSFGVAWAVMAIISAVLFLGIVALMLRGRQWREALGRPSFEDN
jgi:hypothetical protein